MTRFGKGVAGGMGFDTGKLQRMETDPEGHTHPLMGALEAFRQFMQNSGKWADTVVTDTAHDPLKGISHVADPFESVATGVEQGFKNLWAKPSLETAGGALGSLSNVAAGVDEGGGLRDVATAPGKVAAELPNKAVALAARASPAIREQLGVGQSFTEGAVKDWQGKAADVETANRGALAKARTGEEAFNAKADAAKQANEQAKQTALDKQQLQTEAMGHAKELSEHLPQLKEQEKAFAQSLYPEVEGTAPAKEIQGKIQDAIDTNIRGTDKPPAALARIVKELEPENPLSQASVFRGAGSSGRTTPRGVSLDELPASARERVMKELSPEERQMYEAPEQAGGKALTFEQLHGYYSELGEELSRDLAGDERAAVTGARSVLLDQMRKMAESEKKLGQFQEAQKNWGKYENTFNKTWNDKRGVASPIAKALNAKDPVTGEMLPERVAKILSKDENYKLAQQMFSRYDAAKPELLQLMKEKLDQAGTMPKNIKQVPVPERASTPINFKEPPAPPDIPAMKAEVLNKKAETLGGFSGRGMFIDAAALIHTLTTGNPLALSIPIGRRLLARAMKSGAKGSLIEMTPQEAALLRTTKGGEPPNISPSQVHPTKAAALAAKKGLKGGINAQGVEASTRPLSNERMVDSLSNEIDTLKTKLRGAGDTLAKDKAALKSQIDDYQELLDQLRGSK